MKNQRTHLLIRKPWRRLLARLSACSIPAIALGLAFEASPQTVLFSDDFDTDSSAQWEVFEGSDNGVPDYSVDWAFDYGSVQYTSNGVTNTIPPAPNADGTTRGLRLTVNKDELEASAGTSYTAGVSVYPRGQTFSGEFVLKADVWMNYNGPAYGGTGSTEFATFGINHAGDRVVWANANYNGDGVWFTMAGEGGASRDYRAYVGDGAAPDVELMTIDGGFLDRNGDGVFEIEINPAEGDALNPLKFILPAPPGETPGAPGKQWVQVEVRQRLGTDDVPVVTWVLNGHVIAEHSQGAVFGQTEGNIMLGYMDVFASIAIPREDNYVIFDNVRVESLDGVAALPVVEITSDDAAAAEPSDAATLTLTRQGDTTAPLTVALRTLGTATAGEDFEPLPSEVTIPAGESSVTLNITPIDDAFGEADETIIAAIAPGTTYEVRERNAVIVTLTDDGDVPEASITAVRPIAYELVNTRTGRFTIDLSTPALADVTVAYTVSGTAVAGTDYEPIGSSIVVPAGETRVGVDVVPIDNTAMDGARTVEITLSAGQGYRLGEETNATIVIRDDDIPSGETLYSESFDTDNTANWQVNHGPGDGVADFFFDYSTVGVPPAPRSTGTTRGLKLQANLTSGIFSGLSVSPVGQEFTGYYRLRFDLWQNFNGPLAAGGSGSTQITGAGIGTAGTSAQWPGGTQDSVWFASTGDGGSTVDYRAYSPAEPTGYGDASGVFSAGTEGNPRDAANSYYAEFGNQAAPQAQVDAFPDQSGETARGTQGFQWHDVIIDKVGDVVTWSVDGLLIATVNLAGVTLGGGNIHFMHSDINASSSADPNAADMAFGLIDNVVVEALEAGPERPEIESISLSNGMVQIEFTAAASDGPEAFQLFGAEQVTGPYAAEAGATVQTLSPGRFRADLPATGTVRFFQIAR